MGADYRFSGTRPAERFRFSRGRLGLLVVPSGSLTTTSQMARVAQQIQAAQQETRERQVIDQKMWTLDNAWRPPNPGTTFIDARLCVRQPEVGSGITSTPWKNLPDVNACRNVDGRVFGSNCNWGYWQLTPCSLDTAALYMFQYSRYLWAQGRLRELLANPPRQGATDPQAAADWVWLASQYISVIWWSTNVRFDGYGDGAYWNEYMSRGLVTDPNAGIAFPDGHTVIYGAVTPRCLNVVDAGGRDFVRAVFDVPTMQDEFSPGDYATMSEATIDQQNAIRRNHLPMPVGIQVGAGEIVPWNSTTPLGLTDEQRGQIRSEAYALYQASGYTSSLRWAESRAYLNWSFRATWNWQDPWRQIPNVTVYYQGRHGWVKRGPLWAGGAKVVLDNITALATQYARKDLLYTDWMQTAVTAYNVQYTALPLTTEARIAWARTQDQMANAISQSATAERDVLNQNMGFTVLSMASSLLTLFGGYVAYMGYLMQGLAVVTQQIFSAFGILVNERHPCPALPFLRVTTGDCNVDEGSIVSALLGITSNARFPLAPSDIGGKTITFVVDGVSVSTTFLASDTTADSVARRINAAAALALPPSHGAVASVDRSGQVHVQGTDPSAGQTHVSGGNATALGFAGTIGMPTVNLLPDLLRFRPGMLPIMPFRVGSSSSSTSSSGGGVAIAIAALLGIGGYLYSRSKQSPDNLSPEE